MAITDKKGINVTSGFKLISPSPIDARFVVEDENELQSIIDNGAAYNGLEVWVNSLGKKKQFNGVEFVEVQSGGQSNGSSSSLLYETEPLIVDEKAYNTDSSVYCEEGVVVEVSTGNYNYVNNIFFNITLSIEEVTAVLDTLNLRTDENPSDSYYVYYCNNSNNLIITKFETGAYGIAQISGGSSYVIWTSLNGYSKEFKNREYNFVYKPTSSLQTGEVNGIYASIYNDRLKALISIIPYEKIEQSRTPVFSSVPTQGHISKLYVNTQVYPINVIRDIISKLQFVEMGDDASEIYSHPCDGKTYIIFSDSEAKNTLAIYKIDENDSWIPSYYIILRKVSEDSEEYFETGLWNLLQNPMYYDEYTQQFLEALSMLNVECSSEITINGNTYPVGQNNDILSLFSMTPFKYNKLIKSTPKAVPNSGVVEKIYINKNIKMSEVNKLLEQLYFKSVSYRDSNSGNYVYRYVNYLMVSEDGNKRILIEEVSGGYDIILFTSDSEVKIFSSAAEPFGWNDEIDEIEINSSVTSSVYDTFLTPNYHNSYDIGQDNELLKNIFSTTTFSPKTEKSFEKESIQLYRNEEEPKKVFPRTRVEDLRTVNDDKYNVSNITYGETTVIGPKIEYLKGEFNRNNINGDIKKFYINVSLKDGEVINLLKNIEFEWGNDSNDDFDYTEFGPEDGYSSSGSGVTTVVDLRAQGSDENGYYIYNGTKIKVKKILGEYFIEKEIYEENRNHSIVSSKTSVIFSSNSSYAGFYGWNEQEFSEIDLLNASPDYYYGEDEIKEVLSEIFSFTPFEKFERENIFGKEKGIFKKDGNGNPNFDKPVIKFDISNKTTISGNLKHKVIRFNDSLSPEKIKKILLDFWNYLTPENSYEYQVFYYSGNNNGYATISLNDNNSQLSVYVQTRNMNGNLICLDKNGIIEIYKNYIDMFNQSTDLLNETSDYFECETGEYNDLLKDLFYMLADSNFLSLNLDNSSPSESGKPVSHIICNGKSHPVVDADAIVYEEVD